jgi:hypothetical protein
MSAGGRVYTEDSSPGVGGVIRTNIARPCSKYCTLNEINPQKIKKEKELSYNVLFVCF